MYHKTMKEKRNLLDYVRSLPPDRELAVKALIASVKGKKFKTSLTGFRYKEGSHEASRFRFKRD